MKIELASAGAALALGLVPLTLGSYHLGLLTKMLILAIFAMSLNLILGYGGLPSLGHAAYFGIAGYTVALLARRGLEHFWLELIAGIVAATATAALFGLLALRTSGAYLLMITLALAQVLWGIAYGWRSLTPGVSTTACASTTSCSSSSCWPWPACGSSCGRLSDAR